MTQRQKSWQGRSILCDSALAETLQKSIELCKVSLLGYITGNRRFSAPKPKVSKLKEGFQGMDFFGANSTQAKLGGLTFLRCKGNTLEAFQ